HACASGLRGVRVAPGLDQRGRGDQTPGKANCGNTQAFADRPGKTGKSPLPRQGAGGRGQAARGAGEGFAESAQSSRREPARLAARLKAPLLWRNSKNLFSKQCVVTSSGGRTWDGPGAVLGFVLAHLPLASYLPPFYN